MTARSRRSLYSLRNSNPSVPRRRSQKQCSRLDQAIELASSRYHSLLHHTSDAVFLIDPDSGQPLEINPEGEKILGYSQSQLQTLKLSDIFASREKRRYLSLLGRTLRDGEAQEQNLRMRRKDGSKRSIHVRARLLHLGGETLVLGILRDLTGTRQTQERLLQKNLNLQLLNRIVHQVSGDLDLDTMLENILTTLLSTFEADGGGVYLKASESKELELCAEQGIDPELRAQIACVLPGQGLIGRTASTGQPRFSTQLSKDPRLLHPAVIARGWRSFQAVPLIARGETLGVLFFFYLRERILTREEVELLLNIGRQAGSAVERAELFETIKLQHQVAEAGHRELARLERMKTNFLAMASHELRTPTTCVLAGAELLKEKLDETQNPEASKILRVIHEGGLRLQHIITETLEVARIESRGLELHPQRINLPELLTQVCLQSRKNMDERGLRLIQGPTACPPTLRADPHHLHRTLNRLLENALKATPTGGEIHLGARMIREQELETRAQILERFRPGFLVPGRKREFVCIELRDTGIGIEAEEQLRIFDKFYEIGDFTQHYSSRTAFGGKGVGLGLSLVRGVIEAHDGMVWMEPPADGGPGSCFHLLLPL